MAFLPSSPFRYRGYYYDTETEFYYLNSRYYDPDVGRFLNVDRALYHSMQGYNMYAYCYNNPVMYYDPYGANGEAVMRGVLSWWTSIVGTIASIEPTIFGEIGYIVGFGVISIICFSMSGSESDTKNEGVVAPETPSIAQPNITEDSGGVITDEIKSKEEVEPHRRESQKKQGRELKTKARRGDNWAPRNNQRNGMPKLPKSHTPSKKGHKKYFTWADPIELFGGF